MAGETCSLPYQRSWFRQQSRHISTNHLIAGGLLAIWMELVRVAYVPGPDGSAVVVCHGLSSRGELGALGVESVAVLVVRTTDWLARCRRINHEHGILGAVNIGVNPKAEQVLVVVCVHTCRWISDREYNYPCLGREVKLTGIHFGSPSLSVFTFTDRVGVQNAG